MFTGIVEEMGRVAALERREGALRLEIECTVAHRGAAIGDSISVAGVCLTVIAIDGPRLAFEAVPETLRRTNLERLSVGAPVDLERALAAGRPMGGHYVQGHVDGTCAVESVTPDGEALDLWLSAPPELARYLVPKGFVTLDGASLTIVATREASFGVTLVPHTQKSIVLGGAKPGYVANLEVDVMAKYVERSLGPRLEAFEARLAKLERA